MKSTKKEFLLKYGIATIAVVVICIQFFLVNNLKLNRWKGGGYGMYSEIHYYYNQIYINDISVDSLVKTDKAIKDTLGFLMLMPNKENLKKSAKLVLRKTNRDSIHMQIWKPKVSSKNGVYKRVLIEEIYLKDSGQ